MQCIITGCAFLEYGPGSRWVAGDLFSTEDGTWVFNGNMDPNQQPAWIEGTPHYTKQVWAERYWDKRGVIVIESEHLQMSSSAAEYIKG